MDQNLREKLSELDRRTEKLLEEVRTTDPEILQKKPNRDSWSIIQVLDHLITSERASLSYVKKKYLGIDSVRNAGFTQQLVMWLSKAMYGGIFRFKAPVAAIQHPSNESSLEETEEQWRKSREALSEFVESYPQQYVKKAIYKHPMIGRISLSQMIEFFGDHIGHHQAQVRRIKRGL